MSRCLIVTGIACGALLVGCSTTEASGPPTDGTPSERPAEPQVDAAVPSPLASSAATPEVKLSAREVTSYLHYIGPGLTGRTLSNEESSLVTQLGADALPQIFRSWFAEDGFAEAVRGMMELKLAASGKRGSVDFGLAGYLVRHVVRSQLPWSAVLLSQTCYDETDAAIPCDTGAPYTAGVLTTRGFLASNEGRFNLSRAHAVVRTFMCRDYPQETELQPPVDALKLKLMFRAKNADEQQVAEAAGGFGNGLACYSCHGQFSLHAQPFVKFDKTGLYLADATGAQNPQGQLGESERGTFASHWDSPEYARSESSSWFGEEIANLAEGAAVIAKHPKFRECTLQNLLDLAVGLDSSYATGVKGLKVDPAFLGRIARDVATRTADPTIQELASSLYADPGVISATIKGLKR